MEITSQSSIVGGQTSVKEHEICALEEYLPKDCHIISMHSLHGPSISSIGQPLIIINHRSTTGKLDTALSVLKALGSNMVHLDYKEHDQITADTQAVTHHGKKMKKLT